MKKMYVNCNINAHADENKEKDVRQVKPRARVCMCKIILLK